MTPQISNELEQALAAHPEGALKVQGAKGTYWVMTDAAMKVRAEVQKALDQADRGCVEPWDAEEIKLAARKRKQGRSRQV